MKIHEHLYFQWFVYIFYRKGHALFERILHPHKEYAAFTNVYQRIRVEPPSFLAGLYRMENPSVVYYLRKCISCFNKVRICITLPSVLTEAPCPHCKATVRIWP